MAATFAGLLALPAPSLGSPTACLPLGLDGRCPAWAALHDGGSGFDHVGPILTSPDGTALYVAGTTETSAGYRAFLAAYDTVDGERRWSVAEGRAGDQYVTGTAIAISPENGTVFLAAAACGVLTDGSTCDALVTAHDSASGDRLWSVLRDGPGRGLDSAQDVAVSDDGETVYVGGQTYALQTDEDYLVMALDAETGAELWSATYNGPGNRFDRGAAIALAGETLFLTGRSGNDDEADIATVAFDTREEHEGEILWVDRYDADGGLDEPYAIATDPAGDRLLVAGESRSAGGFFSPVVIAYDGQTGSRAWLDLFDDPGLFGGFAWDVTITPDGRYAASTGLVRRGDGKGPGTTLYDARTGERAWRQFHAEGMGTSVAISGDARRVYMTGPTYVERGTMHRTVSYRADTGAERWSGLYEHTAPPDGLRNSLVYFSGMALSPDGTHVYVTGATRPPLATHDDAMTLAYQA